MEEVFSGLDNMDLTLENEKLIVKEQELLKLMIVSYVVTNLFLSLEVLLKVFAMCGQSKGVWN